MRLKLICHGYPFRILEEEANSSKVEELSGLRAESYITTLSDDLFEKCDGRQISNQIVERLSAILPETLRVFSLGFGDKESSQIYLDMKAFIRKHRE